MEKFTGDPLKDLLVNRYLEFLRTGKWPDKMSSKDIADHTDMSEEQIDAILDGAYAKLADKSGFKKFEIKEAMERLSEEDREKMEAQHPLNRRKKNED